MYISRHIYVWTVSYDCSAEERQISVWQLFEIFSSVLLLLSNNKKEEAEAVS